MSGPNVGRVSESVATARADANKRPVQIKVKRGETINTLAKKYGMTSNEFKAWVGLKTNTLKPGMSLNLPNDVVPAGKGIFALAKKYNMTLEEFGKLNNLPKPYKNYTAKQGERFYVKRKGSSGRVQPAKSSSAKRAAGQKRSSAKVQTKRAGVTTNSSAKGSEPRSSAGYTPTELANKIYDGSKKFAAVGKPDFDALIDQITPANVEKVLKAYTKKESLINTITSEVMSGKKAREDAVMHVYDALAKAKGTSPNARAKFYAELHKQLYDVWGMASTKNLDKMIEGMLASKPPKAPTSKIITNKAGQKVQVLKSGYEVGVVGERKVSHTAAKPPIPVDSKGQVIAEVVMYNPTSKGPLSGKTIMVNAGHGWGGDDLKSATFRPGARYKDVNGKMLEEWYKNRNFADNLIEELTRNGAKVVYTTGHAPQACDAKEDFKADMLISIHCNAVDNNTEANGLKIIHDGVNSPSSDRLAQIMDSQLSKHVNYKCSLLPAAQTQHKYIGLIDESNRRKMPAVMLEMGFMSNHKDRLNIDSYNQRKLAMKNVTIAIMKYYKIDSNKYKE